MAYITIKEYSELKNIALSNVYNLIKNGKIKSVVIEKNKYVYISFQELNNLLSPHHANANKNNEANNIKTDNMSLKLLEVLLKKDETIDKKDEVITTLVEENRRMTSAVLNRLEVENVENGRANKHLKLRKT